MKWWPALLALAALPPAAAVERIAVRAASVSMAGAEAVEVTGSLRILSASRSVVELRTARLKLPPELEAQSGALTALRLQCTNPLVREPMFECPQLTLQGKSARWQSVSISGKAGFRSDTSAMTASGGGLVIAGAPLRFEVSGTPEALVATADLPGFKLAEVNALLPAQLPLPADLAITGGGDLHARLQLGSARRAAEVSLTLREAGFQNEAYTWIGEKLGLSIHAAADLARTPLTFRMKVTAQKGQALAGPVLLDFEKNPLLLELTGHYSEQGVQITRVSSQQRDLVTLTGEAHLTLAPFSIVSAAIDASDIRFPAAYTSYLQLPLATTAFNELATTGRADLRLMLRDNAPTQIDLTVRDLSLGDAKQSLQVEGINSELHWSAGQTGPPRPSWLIWEKSQGWGIVGARTRLDFITQDRDFRLLQPARLPFFDGALLIQSLSAENIGRQNMSGLFEATIEPISVAPIARAFGLPEFAGQLSGRIPGLTYKDGVLGLQGNLEANVFDGRVIASNLRIREPLGAWPRLYGDIVARNLDLELITRTFEFGTITGRLDVELTGLETFNWSPVAFDLVMATPKGDRSRHRISQRAVQNLSDIGGGGGGVAAALQSGALKFFDEFGYDRIGLSCRLRNDVCQMSGVGNVDGGFYIVKGRGIPRIDIIGNNTRVDWPRLMTQVADAVRNPGNIELK